MNSDPDLLEEVSAYEHYFKQRIGNKKMKFSNPKDPIVSFYEAIPNEWYKTDILNTVMQREPDIETARIMISNHLQLEKPITMEQLEFVRFAATFNRKNVTRDGLKNIRTKVFRIYAKVTFQFQNEFEHFVVEQKGLSFPAIIWQYLSYFFMFFVRCGPKGFDYFEILSKRIFKSLSDNLRIVLAMNKYDPIMQFVWDFFPTLITVIPKESGTKRNIIYEYLHYFVHIFIEEFYQDYLERFDVISSVLYTFTSIYSTSTQYQKDLISNCISTTCYLFGRMDIPHDPIIYNIGFTCFEFNIMNYDINFAKIIASSITFLKWASNKSIMKSIQLPEQETKNFTAMEIQTKPIKYFSISEFKEHMAAGKRFSEPTLITAIREMSEQSSTLYATLLLMRERGLKSVESSQIISSEVVIQLRDSHNTERYPIFLAICMMLIHQMNDSCVLSSINGDWGIFIDPSLFNIKIDYTSNDPAYVFIRQLQEFIIYFLVEKSKIDKNVCFSILGSIYNMQKDQSNYYLLNLYPFLEYLLYDIPDMFISIFVSSNLFSLAMQFISQQPYLLLSYKLSSFLQILTITAPDKMLNSSQYMNLCQELIIFPYYQDVVKSMMFSLVRENNFRGMLRFVSFAALLIESGIKNMELYSQIAMGFVHAMNNNMNQLNNPDIGNLIKSSILMNTVQLAGQTKNPNDIKVAVSFVKNVFYVYPSLSDLLLPRTAKFATTLTQALLAYDYDIPLLDEMASILLGCPSKFKDVKSIRYYGILSVLLKSIQGKSFESEVLEWIFQLESSSRLNALLCCDGGLMPICLSRLSHLQSNEKNLTTIILNLVTSLFEQFPSTSFMLQLLPAMKASIQSEETIWPLYVLSFLKKLSANQDLNCEPTHVALSFPESYIKAPQLPENIFAADWTFIITIRISETSTRGSAFPLLTIGDPNDYANILIKDNLMSISVKSHKAQNMQLFYFQFENDSWYHIELYFGLNDIILYIDNQKIDAQKRTIPQFPKPTSVYIGSYNDPKIVKKSYADIGNAYIFSGNQLGRIRPGTDFNSIDFSSSIVCFNISNVSMHFGSIPINSPYGQEAALKGFFVPQPVSFTTLFTNQGIWNSFLVVYFGATQALGPDFGVEDPLVLLPVIMSNIIAANVENEKAFSDMQGFMEISLNLAKLGRPLDESIFVSLFKLLKMLRLERTKIDCLRWLWMNPKVHKAITPDAVTFCVSVLTEITINEPDIIMDVLNQPFIVDFINQLTPAKNEKCPAVVLSLIKLFLRNITEKGVEDHVSVLLDLVMSPAHHEILLLALEYSIKLMESGSPHMVNMLKQRGFATPFLPLMHNSDTTIHIPALRCFKLGAEISGTNDDVVMSSVLSLTESMDELKFNATEIFFDSFDYMLGIPSVSNGAIRRRSSAANGESNNRPVTAHYFFPLFAAASTATPRETVKLAVEELIPCMLAFPSSCDLIKKVPFWPYWVIILCQSGYENSKDALTAFRQITSCVLSDSCTRGDFEPTNKALGMLEIISRHLKVDLFEAKSRMLLAAYESFPAERKHVENFRKFAASAFQMIFVSSVQIFDRTIKLGSNPFRLNALERERQNILKITPKELRFHVRVDENNQLIDTELVKVLIEQLQQWVMKRHVDTILYDTGLKTVTMYSYLVLLLAIAAPREVALKYAMEFESTYNNINKLADMEEEHTAIGMFILAAERIGYKCDTMYEKFTFFLDDDDSPELEKLMFEEEILNSIQKIYLVNFM